MKGVLICGGTGSRLRPLTEITNKSLLPVYDKPLLLYPLEVLCKAGIRDIAIVTGKEHMEQMKAFLKDGERFGCTFTFIIQEQAGGIAQALGMAEEFVGDDSVCAILGDNLYFDDLSEQISHFTSGAHVFLKEVHDPERFGVAELEGNRVISIEEKPTEPKSSFAVTGCYIYDNRCFEMIKNMQPSARGEYEITDVSQWYASNGELSATVLHDHWIDAGTFESLHKAAILVRERKLNQTAIDAKDEAMKKAQQAEKTDAMLMHL